MWWEARYSQLTTRSLCVLTLLRQRESPVHRTEGPLILEFAGGCEGEREPMALPGKKKAQTSGDDGLVLGGPVQPHLHRLGVCVNSRGIILASYLCDHTIVFYTGPE